MTPSNHDISRRSVLKCAAVGGIGMVTGAPLLATCSKGQSTGSVEIVDLNQDWVSKRMWSLSGNKAPMTSAGGSFPQSTFARRVYRPRNAQEVSELIKSTPASIPIACICGGHESSNAGIFTGGEALVLDLARMKSITFHEGEQGMLVTVGAGVVFQELVEALKERDCALPVGTGPGVGVIGYIVNGGLSGYFSRRLGLLGQRVVKLTMVTAAGDILSLTPKDELFNAMLGSGSALGVVVDVTIRLEHRSVVQGARQMVFPFETQEQAVKFSRGALGFMKDQVLPNESVSMELVVTGTKALVATFIFYDSFKGSIADFIKPIEQLAATMGLPTVANSNWTTWYETAAALWPVISAQKGDPLVMMTHCVGTKGIPDDSILDFVSDTFIGQAPLKEAVFSLVEIRTLGGAAMEMGKLPSGNCHHAFFVDLVTLYDAKNKTNQERRTIVNLTKRILDKSRAVDGLTVDFSGTHSQPDDTDYCVESSVMFGTPAMAQTVQALKRRMDPDNRFRFHPFAKLV